MPTDITPAELDDEQIAADLELSAAPVYSEYRDRAMEALPAYAAALLKANETNAKLRAALEEVVPISRSLIEIVEGIQNLDYGTWRGQNGTCKRLKDTPEWVAFYVAIRALAEEKDDA